MLAHQDILEMQNYHKFFPAVKLVRCCRVEPSIVQIVHNHFPHIVYLQRIAETMAELEQKAQGTLEFAMKITTLGILLLKEEDKTDIDSKIKQLKEYTSTMTAKTHVEFNR